LGSHVIALSDGIAYEVIPADGQGDAVTIPSPVVNSDDRESPPNSDSASEPSLIPTCGLLPMLSVALFWGFFIWKRSW
ncbi:MAG: hypothetical protein OEV06_07755, partial [Anaerolineae bacterium]|nr:hypothetical protein [Anaerolineae bacterium]